MIYGWLLPLPRQIAARRSHSDEANSEIETLLRARGVSAVQLAAVREEARREVEAFYGVSLS